MKAVCQFPIESMSGRYDSTNPAIVLQNTPYGTIIRKWVRTKNPSTALQNLVRSVYKACSKAFSNISQDERAQWHTYLLELRSRWGSAIRTVMDKDAWMRVNMIRGLCSFDFSTTPPTSRVHGPLMQATNLVCHTQNRSFSVQYTVTNSENASMIIITHNSMIYMGPSRKYRKGDIRWPSLPCHKSVILVAPGTYPCYFINDSQMWDSVGYAWIAWDFYSEDFDQARTAKSYMPVSAEDNIWSSSDGWLLRYDLGENKIILTYSGTKKFTIDGQGVIRIPGQVYEQWDIEPENQFTSITSDQSHNCHFCIRYLMDLNWHTGFFITTDGDMIVRGHITDALVSPAGALVRYLDWNIFEPILSLGYPNYPPLLTFSHYFTEKPLLYCNDIIEFCASP